MKFFFVTKGYDLDGKSYNLNGGFNNREGEELFSNAKKSFVKQGIPINISGGLSAPDTTQTSFDTGGSRSIA